MLIDIPTGVLPEVIVEELPQTGEENKVYRRLVEDEDLREMQITDDFIWYDGEFHPFSFEAKVYGAYFERYQNAVEEEITALKEAVFGLQTTFQMYVSSSVRKTLNLVDGDGNIVVPGALQTERWNFDEVTCQVTVPRGTYYLRSEDNYAIGVSGEILPLVVDGTPVVNLGEVKVILLGGAK